MTIATIEARAWDGTGVGIGHQVGTDNVLVSKINEIIAALNLLTGAGGTITDLIFDAATELTIASGAITVTQAVHNVDTESDAASDDLTDISGLAAGELLVLYPNNTARTVVLKHAVGASKIACPAGEDISLAEATDWALLMGTGTQAVVLAYSTLAFAGGGLGAALAGVAASKGASLVGVQDASGWQGAVANVEAARVAIEVAIGGTNSTTRTPTRANTIVANTALFAMIDALDQRLDQDLLTTSSPTFANLLLTGNLVILGDSVKQQLEDMLVEWNYTLQNMGYRTAVAQTGGLVVNYLPTATVDTTVGAGVFTLGVVGVSDPTVTTAGAATFAANDIVMLSGTANSGENDGIYEVVSHAGNVLTIRSTAAGLTSQLEPWTSDQFVANAGDTGANLTKITVAVLRAGTDGRWEVAAGAVTTLVYSDLATILDLTITGFTYNYTSNTVVVDNEALCASIDKIDIALGALVAENTDGQIQIPILAGVGDAGTWTAAVAAGLETVTHTPAAAAESYWIPIPAPNRTGVDRGIKPTGLRVNYTVATADLDDVRFEVWKVTQGADGAARTAAVLFGEDNADYDAAHDSAVKRSDDTANPELHLAIVADAGAPAYLGTGETLLLRVYVDGDAGAAGVFVLTSAILLYSEANNDIA